MKKHNQSIQYSRISVIGLKGFPAEFTGTTGIESYVEQIVLHTPDINYCCYVRDEGLNSYQNVITKKILTVRQKHLNSIIYGLRASLVACQDASHIIWYHAIGSSLFCWLPKLFGKKIMITFHGLDWQRKKWSQVEKKLLFFFTRLILLSADIVTTVSQREKTELQKLISKEVYYLPPGYFVHSPHLSSKKWLKPFQLVPDHYLLFFGRLVPEKRIEWLIYAFRSLSHPTLQLVIAGDEAFTSEYKKQLLTLTHHHPNIIFTGYVFGKVKVSLIKFAKAVIHPSELEGNSLSVLEALSLGTPVLMAKELLEPNIKNHPLLSTFIIHDFSSFKQELVNLVRKKRKAKIADAVHLRNWRDVGNDFKQLLIKN